MTGKLKVISFCLYGERPIYVKGAYENCKLAKKIYEGWKIYFFVHNSVSKIIITNLESLGAKCIIINEEYNRKKEYIIKCRFWRFYALDNKKIKYVIFRDCDSRLNFKEKIAVDDWIKSEKRFHLMYDHIDHSAVIMAGMWGAKTGIVINIKNLIKKYQSKYDRYYRLDDRYDAFFLRDIIWDRYTKYNYLAHCDKKKINPKLKKKIKYLEFQKIEKKFIHKNHNNKNYIGEKIKV